MPSGTPVQDRAGERFCPALPAGPPAGVGPGDHVVVGAVVASLSRVETAQRPAGQTLSQWQQAQKEYLARVSTSGRFPHLAAALTPTGSTGEPQPPDALFDRILTRVLTGLLQPEHL